MLHKVNDAALVLIRDGLLFAIARINELDLEALVQKCHRLQPLGDGTRNELNAFGLEDGWVWPELNRGTSGATAPWGFA